jgi:hypothetical protein
VKAEHQQPPPDFVSARSSSAMNVGVRLGDGSLKHNPRLEESRLAE